MHANSSFMRPGRPNDRPSMLEVSSMLKNETAALTTPKKPAFSRKTDGEEKNKCTLQQSPN